ncbi:MAG: phosphodiester glycosidase family protein [Planctomycetes bacterium]|nr:phosphodiester glycosidase family protein [Planctomycetota bacterium]
MRTLLAFAALSAALVPRCPAQEATALRDAEWIEREVGEGVVWRHTRTRLFAAPQSLNLLVVDRARAREPGAIRVAAPQPAARVFTSSLAVSSGALGAVNGGFFDLKTGAADGLLVVDGETLGAQSAARKVALVVRKDGAPDIVPARDVDVRTVRGALAAGPWLVKDGEPVPHGRAEDPRHPRTAVGMNRDGALVFVTADGRDDAAAGLSLSELRAVMQALGCVDALNLDGGGSTTMWLSGRGVVNYPCDDRRFDHAGERAVGNAITIFAPLVVVLDEDEARCEPAADFAQRHAKDAQDGDWLQSDAPTARVVFELRLPRPGRYALELRVPSAARGAAWRVAVDGGEPRELRAGAARVGIGEITLDDQDHAIAVVLDPATGPLAVDALRAVELVAPAARSR